MGIEVFAFWVPILAIVTFVSVVRHTIRANGITYGYLDGRDVPRDPGDARAYDTDVERSR
jgi:hypothetical protein